MARDPVILMLAGEPSGDLHGAALARSLLEKWPSARLLGLGGERMAAEGVECLAGLDQLAVMGFAEVVRHLGFFRRLMGRVRAAMHRHGVNLVIPIDYPGFNLRVAKYAREAGIRVLYYIAPQVWAWRPGRARRLARDTDHVAVILPFEAGFLQRAGARATFVGHPLLEIEHAVPARADYCRAHGLDARRPLLALFPGSRRQELDRHLEVFLSAARRLGRARPQLQIVVARPPGLPARAYSGVAATVVEDGRSLLRHARAALVKSGTSTVEAALAGVPFATAYRTHPLTFALARRLVRVDHIAMANLIAGRRVVPELIQHEATPARLERALLPLLDDTAERRAVVAGLGEVRRALGSAGAARRVAAIAESLLFPSPKAAAG